MELINTIASDGILEAANALLVLLGTVSAFYVARWGAQKVMALFLR